MPPHDTRRRRPDTDRERRRGRKSNTRVCAHHQRNFDSGDLADARGSPLQSRVSPEETRCSPLPGLTASRPGRTGSITRRTVRDTPRLPKRAAVATDLRRHHPRTGTRPRRSTACSFPAAARSDERGNARLARTSFARYRSLGCRERARGRLRERSSRSDPASSHPARDAVHLLGPANAIREAGFPGAGGAPPGGPPRPMMPTAGPPGVGAAGGPPRGPVMGGPGPAASAPGQFQGQYQGQPRAQPTGSAPNGFAPPTAQMARMGVGGGARPIEGAIGAPAVGRPPATMAAGGPPATMAGGPPRAAGAPPMMGGGGPLGRAPRATLTDCITGLVCFCKHTPINAPRSPPTERPLCAGAPCALP